MGSISPTPSLRHPDVTSPDSGINDSAAHDDHSEPLSISDRDKEV